MTRSGFNRQLDRHSVQLIVLLVVGLLVRAATFGDPNVHVDEAFYLLVGDEMHHGMVPYVDIWDRKPLGLFIAYWVFAWFRNAILAYQIGAWLSASATAYLICRIASRWMPPAAALAGGVLYLCMLGVLLGMGGQSPVFYNTLVAGGGLLVLQFREGGQRWRLYGAMLLLGVAITFKQTAFFEASFFGLLAVVHHRNWRTAALQIFLGAAPFLAIGLWYLHAGHWPEFYNAMVTANVKRPHLAGAGYFRNSLLMGVLLGPLACTAAYALAFSRECINTRIMLPWLAAAVAGYLSVPYLIEHYALPLLVPLCVIAGAAWARKPIGPFLCAFVGAMALLVSSAFDVETHRQSRAEFDRMAAAVGNFQSRPGLLVFDGPPLLYRAANAVPMSPLVFPQHLYSDFERDLGPRPSGPELLRIIALQPAAVVMAETPMYMPPDPSAYRALQHYVRTQCRTMTRATEYLPFRHSAVRLVYTDCARAHPPG